MNDQASAAMGMLYMKGITSFGMGEADKKEDNLQISSNKECPGRGSNPHGLRGRGILSPLCLPIPPPGRHNG